MLLDEPTAQLDVRGEAEIFDRILAPPGADHDPGLAPVLDRAPRRPDLRLEHGRVIELGSHDELMAPGGRYRTMFDLQAQRFDAAEPDEEGVEYRCPQLRPRRRPGRAAAGACRRCGGCASSATSHEPRLLVVAFVLALLAALPDALLALWLKLLGRRRLVERRRPGSVMVAALGLGRLGDARPGSCASSRRGCSAGSATR